MDPSFYERLWNKTFDEYDPNALRTRRQKHPIVEKWLADDARGSDRALNPLYFLYRPYFRTAVRKRRLRILNALMWVLKSEGFALEADGRDIIVGRGRHRAKFSIIEGTDRPLRATSPTWRKPNGHLSCRIDARVPDGIDSEWEDEPHTPLEAIIPDILASFTVWAEQQNRNDRANLQTNERS
jgi:hypothetical protein